MVAGVLRGLAAVLLAASLAACAGSPPPTPSAAPAATANTPRLDLLARIDGLRSGIAGNLTDAAEARARAAETANPLPDDSPRKTALLDLIDPMKAQEKEMLAALGSLGDLRQALNAGGAIPDNAQSVIAAAAVRADAADQRDQALRHRLELILGPGS